MRVDEKQLRTILKCIRSDNQFAILEILNRDNGYTYTELKTKFTGDNSVFAFHLGKLVKAQIVKKENGVYFLTRIGIECMKLIDNFKKICMTFDLDDCDADGRVKLVIVR